MAYSILVVEDELDNANVLRMLFEAGGHIVLVAWDMRSARTMLAGEPTRLALVVLDLLLPDGSGFDLLREITGAAPAVPVIVVTACAEPSARDEALRSGAALFLTKPFSVDDLEAAVDGLGVFSRFSRDGNAKRTANVALP